MSEAEKLPLIRDFVADKPIMLRGSQWVSQGAFLSDVMDLSKRLPKAPYIINLCRDRYHFSRLFCATLARGMTSLLPPNRQPAIIEELIDDYKQSICVIDSKEDMTASNYLDVNALEISGTAQEQNAVPSIAGDLIAAIAFTSGSTGKPSPNTKRWRTLTGTAEMLGKRLVAQDAEPVIVATVPSQHMYGLEMTLMMALYGRAVMSTGHPFFPQDIADILDGIPPNRRFLVTTPVHLRAITGLGAKTPKVRKIVSATAPLAKEMAKKAEDVLGATVEEIYGCTEAGSIATRKTIAEESWTLLEGMSMYISKEGPVVGGPQLDGGRLLTDNLTYLGEGVFRFLGRSADMINVGGKRASLVELTQKLLSIDGVDDAIVFFYKENDETGRPAALVVSALDERTILRALEKKLDAVFLPRPLKRVRKIPRNETGKPTLNALRALLD